MAITIPRQQQQALKAIAAYSPERRRTILDAFAAIPAGTSPNSLPRQIAEQLGDVARPEATALVTLALSLMALRFTTDWDASFTAKEVVEAAHQSEVLDLPADSAERSELAAFIAKLLSFDSLALASKAADLLMQGEKILLNSRIVSDIRPIFLAGKNLRPAGALLVHNLNLVTRSPSGEDHSIAVLMESTDLAELKKVVDRAIQKEAELKAIVAEAGLALVDIKEEE